MMNDEIFKRVLVALAAGDDKGGGGERVSKKGGKQVI
jgi:hypothetical protein